METQAGASHFKLSAVHCSACEVSFKSPEARRSHAKSKWHVENLRRRVAGLDPLDPPQGDDALARYEGPERRASPTASDVGTSDGSDDSSGSSDGEPDEEAPAYVAEDCLFCAESSENLDSNVEHMHKAHGLFIPDREHLIVDLGTLIKYLHLVIFSFHECLYCHSQRSTVEAAQQHMLGKGHCKLDLSSDDSEFLDFYDFEEHEEDSTIDQTTAAKPRSSAAPLSKVDDQSARLPSGKLLSHRSAPQTQQARQKHHQSLALVSSRRRPTSSAERAEQQEQQPPMIDPAHITKAPSGALTKSERRENAITLELANLSLRDRSALAHLPLSEQRAVLVTQKKQADKAQRAERRHRSRVEMMGNQTLMQNFVNDVPGRKNG